MQSSIKGFGFGLAVSFLILVSFFAGGLADRVFVLKPINLLTRSIERVPLLQAITPKAETPDTPTVLNADERSVVDIADKASESVVTVAIKRSLPELGLLDDEFLPYLTPRQRAEAEKTQRDIGTGFVLTADG